MLIQKKRDRATHGLRFRPAAMGGDRLHLFAMTTGQSKRVVRENSVEPAPVRECGFHTRIVSLNMLKGQWVLSCILSMMVIELEGRSMVLEMSAVYPVIVMPERPRAHNKAPTIPGTFGDLLRHVREAKGLTQPAFAALVGGNMTFTDVSQLERGKVELPDIPRVVDIARALNRPPGELLAVAGYPAFLDQWPPELRYRVPSDIARMMAQMDETMVGLVVVFARSLIGEKPETYEVSDFEARRIRGYATHLMSGRGERTG